MGTIAKVLSGTAVLIALYLVIKNAGGTTSIINALGNVYTKSVTTLQGR